MAGHKLRINKDEFQSTLSMRRATRAPSHAPNAKSFQSTLSMRRATSSPNTPARHGGSFQSTLSMRTVSYTHLTLPTILRV